MNHVSDVRSMCSAQHRPQPQARVQQTASGTSSPRHWRTFLLERRLQQPEPKRQRRRLHSRQRLARSRDTRAFYELMACRSRASRRSGIGRHPNTSNASVSKSPFFWKPFACVSAFCRRSRTFSKCSLHGRSYCRALGAQAQPVFRPFVN